MSKTLSPRRCSLSLPLIYPLIVVASVAFGLGVSQPLSHTTSTSSSERPANSLSSFCEHWKTFKNPHTGLCTPCSDCPAEHVIVTRCEFDRDTLCRPAPMAATELTEHIQTVVSQVTAVSATHIGHNTILMMNEKTVVEELVDGSSYSTSLVITLSALVTSCIFIVSLYALKRCRNRGTANDKDYGAHDPLERGLLDEENLEEENEKPALDMDEMLAQRYGRSLVTNTYVL